MVVGEFAGAKRLVRDFDGSFYDGSSEAGSLAIPEIAGAEGREGGKDEVGWNSFDRDGEVAGALGEKHWDVSGLDSTGNAN